MKQIFYSLESKVENIISPNNIYNALNKTWNYLTYEESGNCDHSKEKQLLKKLTLR